MTKRTLKSIPLSLAFLALVTSGAAAASVTDFRADSLSNLSNDPVFSWKLQQEGEGTHQAAYQLMVSEQENLSNPDDKVFWKSEMRTRSTSHQETYDGPHLKNGQRYFARVRTWSNRGDPSSWSDPLPFTVPLRYPEDWKAQWITYDYKENAPLPLFRKSFQLPRSKQIAYARFYIAAPSYYEARLNGEKIGEYILDPGQTNFDDYTYYTAYEIDPKALVGKSTLGVMLGNGWYNQNQVWRDPGKPSPMVYGQPVFSCQLVVHYLDGKSETIVSDSSWEWTPGPITYSNVYGGEHYDARREITGWDTTAKSDAPWSPAAPATTHPTELFEQFAEPIKIMSTIAPERIIERPDGSYMVDMGQNMAGWLQLKIDGEAGQEITIQCTEVLDGKGDLDPSSTGMRATKLIQTLKYTCKGGGTEIWEPRFTYFGFRYAHVTGLKKRPDSQSITGKVVYSSLESVGDFTSSVENINKLHTLSRWTIKGNIHSIPTDCPHREKCGWTGDSHALLAPTIYNWDAQRFFQKYMFDMRSSARVENRELYFGDHFHDRSTIMKPKGIPTMIVPGRRTSGTATPDWGTAMVQIPWGLYTYYGDRSFLKSFYPDMKVWVDYVSRIMKDGIIPHGLGDWCPPGGNKNKDCPVPVSSTAFHILDVSIMEQAAALFGLEEDRQRYGGMLKQLKADFNRHFFNEKTQSYGTSQTANIMALDLDIAPQDKKQQVAAAIVKNIHDEFNGFLNTGIFGLARAFKVLSENGYEAEVYRLLTKTGNNSFALMWDRHDATTLWESLPTAEDASRSGSMNHPMQAGFDAWFYSGIAGINPTADAPGFRKIIFKPYLTRQLDHASASYNSKAGLIKSAWKNSSNGLDWQLAIPANCEGQIWVPTYGKKSTIQINGQAARVLASDQTFSLIGTYGPGDYVIQTK